MRISGIIRARSFKVSLNAIFPVFLSAPSFVVYSLQKKRSFLPSSRMREHITFTSRTCQPAQSRRNPAIPLESYQHEIHDRSERRSRLYDMKLFASYVARSVVLMHGYSTTETRGIAQMMHRLDNVDNNALGGHGKPVPFEDGLYKTLPATSPAGEIGEIVVEAKALTRKDSFTSMTFQTPAVSKMPSGNCHSFPTGDLLLTLQGYLEGGRQEGG